MTENVKDKIRELSKENAQNVVLQMMEFLSEAQCDKLETLIKEGLTGRKQSENNELESIRMGRRMSQDFVDEKMKQIEEWMRQIDEGELYLDTEEYEDYSSGYWDPDWITEYYDRQEIGIKIASAIQFAYDCVDDGRYREANRIYEWLWEMCVATDSEYDDVVVDLEVLNENDIVRTDMKQLALLTLYADYQVQEPENRAADIYLYFTRYSFQKLHIEEMFHVGRENLTETGQFLDDWIVLLQTKSGDVEGRLLQEAVLYRDGIGGLVKIAEANGSVHPSLYLTAMSEYEKNHDYLRIEEIGAKALEALDSKLIIRSDIALKAAYASSCLQHTEKMMQFCWEAFKADSTDRNFLRLFGTAEMAKLYGMRGREVFAARQKGNPTVCPRNAELQQNIIGDMEYYKLCFYNGDFDKAKQASKNPTGSLGWSGSFMPYGIRLFLLYLYEKPLPSKAVEDIAAYVGFQDPVDLKYAMDFERKIDEQSREQKTSVFWNYFQRWKLEFSMSAEEKEQYLDWAEKIVYARADAIVRGQHRKHYGEVAALLAVVAEIKDIAAPGEGQRIFWEYKKKFPRHSSFQSEMRGYFWM